MIKCSFISFRAPTKVQNRIKQSRGTLPLLMLRPFENLLAMRRATMLQGRITEQRDGGIWNEVWEPSSTSFISTSKPLKCFPYHQIVLVQTASLTRFSISPVRGMLIVARLVSADRGATAADVVDSSGERDVHSSSEVQSRQ